MFESVTQVPGGRAGLIDVFDQISATDEQRRRLEANQALLIAEACDRWQVDESTALAACERFVQGGADGTASVGEFLALELGPLLRVTPVQAACRIADVLNLRDRHPLLWAAVQELRVEVWQASKITSACIGLKADAARWVDRQVDSALRIMPWHRVMRSVAGLVVRADPALAAERAAAEKHRRQVWVGDFRDGGGTVYARLSAVEAALLDETVSDLANRLATPDDTRTTDQRRAAALGLLAEPERAAAFLAGGEQPPGRCATLVVHLPAGAVIADDPGTVATVEGVGVLTRSSLVEFLNHHGRVTVKPVVDFNEIPPVDSYQVPPLMRAAVLSRWPVEAFPFGARRSPGCDLDHSKRFDRTAPCGAGQSRTGNLAPLSRRAHRAKTRGGWQVGTNRARRDQMAIPNGLRVRSHPHWHPIAGSGRAPHGVGWWPARRPTARADARCALAEPPADDRLRHRSLR